MNGTPDQSRKIRLEADLTVAMKARDALTTGTLRMLLAAIRTEEVAGDKARELSDDEVLGVLVREAKKRREAAEAFTAAGRSELTQRELAEGAIIDQYLPAPLSDDELATIVADAIAETGATGVKQLGVVMKIATGKVARRAEGGRVAAEVRRQLAS